MKTKKFAALILSLVLMLSITGCGSTNTDKVSDITEAPVTDSPVTVDTADNTDAVIDEMTDEERIISAAQAGMVGNWGLGNEYEIQALLSKYGQPTDYVSMDFTMDQFDADAITLASAMTYNELGLVVNDYDGGYGYGDSVGIIDMNDQGVAMLEDMIFCTKSFAESNPNTVKAFVAASLKGWKYACENPEEAAEIVYKCMSFAKEGALSRFAELARAIGVAKAETDDGTAADLFSDALSKLCKTLEVPTLKEYGIDKESFLANIDKMADDALASGSPANTVKNVTKSDIVSIYKSLFD